MEPIRVDQIVSVGLPKFEPINNRWYTNLGRVAKGALHKLGMHEQVFARLLAIEALFTHRQCLIITLTSHVLCGRSRKEHGSLV